MTISCEVNWLGRDVDYHVAWDLQRKLAAKRVDDHILDTLLMLEHAPVYTAGRLSKPEHFLLHPDELMELGIPVVVTDRGGQVTYHGPGQLIGYPIFKLATLGIAPAEYLRELQQVLIDTVRSFDLDAVAERGHTGVWVRGEKIAAIGLRVRQGVTLHGFALNVDPDLGYFRHIVPCGLIDRPMTSMARLLNRPVSVEETRSRLLTFFTKQFCLDPHFGNMQNSVLVK